MLIKITSIVLAIIGLAIAWMGGELLLAGGSPFYIVMALGFLLTAWLLRKQRLAALSVYALLMWLVLFWTVYEVGFDKWQWIPRGDVVGLFGLWLALPNITKTLTHGVKRFHGVLSSTLVMILLIVVGVMFYDPYPQPGELTSPRQSQVVEGANQDWSAYGGTPAGQRFSQLNQINRKNITQLEVAWTYHTGDLRNSKLDATEYTFEATPLSVNHHLYLCTPHNEVHALNPQTGALQWKYQPAQDPSYLQQHQTCRGVSYFADTTTAMSGSSSSPALCQRRIFMATADAKLVALDADSGKLCSDFGQQGIVDLHNNMGNVRPHALMQTAAPLVAGHLVIVGGSVMDNGYATGNPSGVIRAYDVHSGQLVWNFDPAQPDKTQPIANDAHYPQDTPVAWGTLSADLVHGLVYVPFGNASPDEVGIDRQPDSNTEKFRDTLVALDLNSGKLKWSFQTSLHDLWDRDNPSQPSLLTIDYQGEKQPVIILPTKVGNLFVLNRLTGKAVYPVKQVPVSTQGGVSGEKFSPTQPLSALNFIPETLNEKSMWGITPFDQIACRINFKQLRYDGNPWTPATEKGSIIFPGNIGVFNWGSVAVDPQRQLLIASPVRLAYRYNLLKRTAQTQDKRLFTPEGTPYWNENFQGRYAIHIQQFISNLGIPCIAPPWGRLVGVDLKTGKTAWLRRVGTTKNLKTSFLPGRFPIGFPMGMVAHGGSLITAGNLIFQGATADNFFRAYDVDTGQLLWQTELPAGGQSTPATYLGNDNKQYVVIAAGGHGSLGTTAGDSVVAYRLK